MRRRVRREWLWFVILVITILFAVIASGCNPTRKTEDQEREEYVARREVYYAEHFLEIEYEGHTYIVFSRNERMGLTHAAHCKARH